ncbi:hypothetical protein [Paraburkholderia phenoliruptrix]|uniref:hypothetical protein n=1 Tax=Paraburkholderia phenoliruptrix TaxID=252970 RepID=UPI0015837A14|nr:hypothetical protein [Paraburkholderia phenoliruptrix]
MSLLVWMGSLGKALRVGCGGCAPKEGAWGCAPVETSVALWGDAVFDTGARSAGGGADTTSASGSSVPGAADSSAARLDNFAALVAVVDSTGASVGPDSSDWLAAGRASPAAASVVASAAATVLASSDSRAAVAASERALRSPAVAAAVSRGLPR